MNTPSVTALFRCPPDTCLTTYTIIISTKPRLLKKRTSKTRSRAQLKAKRFTTRLERTLNALTVLFARVLQVVLRVKSVTHTHDVLCALHGHAPDQRSDLQRAAPNLLPAEIRTIGALLGLGLREALLKLNAPISSADGCPKR